jgi:hypothetical protein
LDISPSPGHRCEDGSIGIWTYIVIQWGVY